MSVLYIAIPVVLFLAILGIIGFIWSVRSGQMDDLETPGIRPLLEDDPVDREPRERNKNSHKEAQKGIELLGNRTL